MESIEFIAHYETYLDEIGEVVKPEFLRIIDDLKKTDAHDLVSPETFFMAESHARGYVWSLFLQLVKKNSSSK
jgi:hypothetical protein